MGEFLLHKSTKDDHIRTYLQVSIIPQRALCEFDDAVAEFIRRDDGHAFAAAGDPGGDFVEGVDGGLEDERAVTRTGPGQVNCTTTLYNLLPMTNRIPKHFGRFCFVNGIQNREKKFPQLRNHIPKFTDLLHRLGLPDKRVPLILSVTHFLPAAHSYDCLHIGTHDSCHPVNIRRNGELIHGSLSRTPTLP